MSSKIIDPTREKKLDEALRHPHGLLVIDQVLHTKTDGYQAYVTLGWTTPHNALQAVATLVMPIPFVTELADALKDLVADASARRKSAGT